jgi:hypothetical protein
VSVGTREISEGREGHESGDGREVVRCAFAGGRVDTGCFLPRGAGWDGGGEGGGWGGKGERGEREEDEKGEHSWTRLAQVEAVGRGRWERLGVEWVGKGSEPTEVEQVGCVGDRSGENVQKMEREGTISILQVQVSFGILSSSIGPL